MFTVHIKSFPKTFWMSNFYSLNFQTEFLTIFHILVVKTIVNLKQVLLFLFCIKNSTWKIYIQRKS